MTVPIFSVLIC